MKFRLKLPRVTTPQERVVSFRGTAYLWDKILRVTLRAPGVRDTLKSETGEKGAKAPDVILLSLPQDTVVMCKRSLMKSGGLTRWT